MAEDVRQGPAAGWYADPSGEHRLRYWDGNRWLEDTQGDAPLPDPGFRHFLRFFGVLVLLQLSFLFIVGLVWLMFILSQVGYRKRDVLLTFIPIYGEVVLVRTVWRYTARNAYWSPHPGRPSHPLAHRWVVPLSVAGWLLFVVLSYVITMETFFATTESEASGVEWRQDFVDYWTGEGKSPAVARCAAQQVDNDRPYASEGDLVNAIEMAFAACELR